MRTWTIVPLCLLGCVALIGYNQSRDPDTVASAETPEETNSKADDHMTAQELEAKLAEAREALKPRDERGVTVTLKACIVIDGKKPLDCYSDDGDTLLVDMEARGCYELGSCAIWEQVGLQQDGLSIIAIGTPLHSPGETEEDEKEINGTMWGLAPDSPLLAAVRKFGCTDTNVCTVRRISDTSIRVTDPIGLSEDIFAPRRT